MTVVALADGEVAQTEPKLDVELLPRDPTLLCIGVARVPGGVKIRAACRTASFADIDALYAVAGERRSALFFGADDASKSAELTFLDVLVPAALLKEHTEFQLMDRRGRLLKTLVAGLRPKLPAKWRFAPYQLNLVFDPAPAAALEPTPARCFVRSITVSGDNLLIDLSVFVSTKLPEVPEAAELVIDREGSDGDLFAAPFALASGKKAFRIPASLHRQLTKMSVLHGQISVPALSVFDDVAIYDPAVAVGGERMPLLPYNLYYFEKPSTFVINSGVSSHILRHFSDPATGAVRLSFQ